MTTTTTTPKPAEVRAMAVPAASRLQPSLAGASFHDCYGVEVAGPERSALGHFLQSMALTPAWVDHLMRLRNRVVRLVGLKDLGALSSIEINRHDTDYRPGDRVGIFTLLSVTPDEVVLGDHDKHLHVAVSVMRLPSPAGSTNGLNGGRQHLAVSTVVHVHNTLGRLYMLPVKPLHQRIVPAVLRQLARQPG